MVWTVDTLSFHVQVAAWFLFSIHWFSGYASVGWCHSLGFLFLSLLFFSCFCAGYIGHEYGCHALVLEFFWCIPSFPFALIYLVLVWVCLLRVFSLLWTDLDPFLPFPMLLCIWSDLLFQVLGFSCAHPFQVCLAGPFILSLLVWVFSFDLQGSSLGSYFPSC